MILPNWGLLYQWTNKTVPLPRNVYRLMFWAILQLRTPFQVTLGYVKLTVKLTVCSRVTLLLENEHLIVKVRLLERKHLCYNEYKPMNGRNIIYPKSMVIVWTPNICKLLHWLLYYLSSRIPKLMNTYSSQCKLVAKYVLCHSLLFTTLQIENYCL